MKLALFFSHGISLKDWEDIGHLNREVEFYKKLADDLEEVIFLTYGGKDDLNYQAILTPKIKIKAKPKILPKALYGFLLPFIHWSKLKTTDVFKTNQMSSALPAVIAKIIFPKKKLIVRCGYEWMKILVNEKKSRWKKLAVYCWEKIAYKAADIIIFTSQKDRDFAQKKFKIPQRKIRLIPNYINTELFKPQNVQKEKNSVVYVGRLSKEKNLSNLITAMAGLPAKLTIIGQGSLQKELQALAREKNVTAEFKGKIANQDLSVELNKHSIFVLPSFYEGCPKALLEAMSCGLCCLGADVEGIKEVISHKENGYLCQTDAPSIHRGLAELLTDNTLQKKLGALARETIVNNFSLDEISARELAVYKYAFTK
ncbi:MAG: glycosyltransferase family 4 protein [Patescibacteria group bacterium]|nr:glycosyltransferase family 4 protein [Patescibacteria group bacterium]